jgi:hypothetical protein
VIRLAPYFLSFANGWLQPVTEYKAIEHNLAKIIHWVLIIAMIIMPMKRLKHRLTWEWDKAKMLHFHSYKPQPPPMQ